MTKRILFVDDEHMVLRGIERSLHAMKREWHIEFLPGGAEALQAMEHTPFDVVITDMRMPGMDGAQLLQQVKERFPRTVRMALSGQSDRATILRSVGPTHQYLSKPCEVEELKQKLVRALALRDLLDNATLKEAVSRLETVPSLPGLHADWNALLQNSRSSITEAAQIIARDMGMTAKVLQLVNSAFLGPAVQEGSSQKAASLIGLDNLRTLTLSLRLFVPFESSAAITHSLIDVWNHSLDCALLARAIARAQGCSSDIVESAYTSGLLHDIGMLVLASARRDEYEAVLRTRAEKKLSAEGERQAFGSSHARVGGYLLGLWGLPQPIVDAVAWHHDPAQVNPSSFSPLIAVHVANALQNQMDHDTNPAEQDLIDRQLLQRLELLDQLPVWVDAARQLHLGEEEHARKNSAGR